MFEYNNTNFQKSYKNKIIFENEYQNDFQTNQV